VVIAVNLFESKSLVQNYQNLYPNILMLRGTSAVWNQYKINNAIPTNYVIGHELNQIVDFRMEGYSHTLITNRLKDLVSDVNIIMTSGQPSYQVGTPLDLNIEFKNWSSSTQDFYAIFQVGVLGTYYTMIPLTNIVVAPTSSYHFPLTNTVPLNTPPEIYTLRVIIGVTGDLWYIEKMDVEITL
jgi:hypothetical protein